MNCKIITLLMVVAGSASAATTQSGRVLKAVVSDTNTAPYAIFARNGTLVSGLAKDLIDQIGASLHRPVDYLNLPRGRVTDWMLQGQADIGCFLNPSWVNVQGLAWTPAIFETRQLIIRRREDNKFSSVLDLRKKRIGTTRGFVYPELQNVFSSGLATRDDASSLESNIQRLKHGRVDAVMTVDLSYGYLQQTQPDDALAADPLWAEPSPVDCALNPQSSESVRQIQKAVEALIRSGQVEAMLTKWGNFEMPGQKKKGAQ